MELPLARQRLLPLEGGQRSSGQPEDTDKGHEGRKGRGRLTLARDCRSRKCPFGLAIVKFEGTRIDCRDIVRRTTSKCCQIRELYAGRFSIKYSYGFFLGPEVAGWYSLRACRNGQVKGECRGSCRTLTSASGGINWGEVDLSLGEGGKRKAYASNRFKS